MTLCVIGNIDTDAKKPAGDAAPPAQTADAAPAAPAESTDTATNEDVKATPVARKLAADEIGGRAAEVFATDKVSGKTSLRVEPLFPGDISTL